MGYGSEIILGFQYPRWKDVFSGTVDLDPSILGEKWGKKVEKAFYHWIVNYENPLKEAHKKAIEEAGLSEFYSFQKASNSIQAFRLALYYDPYEMHESPEHATFGISLNGRYFPVFLDCNKELWPIVFNDELNKIIGIAKKHIVAALPLMADADVIVKELHY